MGGPMGRPMGGPMGGPMGRPMHNGAPANQMMMMDGGFQNPNQMM